MTGESAHKKDISKSEEAAHGSASGVGLTEEAEEKRFATQRDQELLLKMARDSDKEKNKKK